MFDHSNTLTYDYDRAELREVGWRLRRLSSACRCIDRLLLVGIPAAALAILWFRTTTSPIVWLAYIAGLITWCAAAPWLHRRLSDLCFLVAMFDRYRCYPATGRVQVKIAPEGIMWHSTHSDRFTHWQSVERIVMDDHYVYIQINFRTYNWIPRRLFQTDAQWAAFFAHLETLARDACRTKPSTMNPQPIA